MMFSTLQHKIAAELSGPSLPLSAFGIALNLTVGQITALLKLPIYLDSIGTILVAVLSGPWVAALTGAFSNLMAAAIGNPSMVFFVPVMIVIAMFTAFLARLRWFQRWYLWALGGILQGILAAVVSAPISAYVFGGTMMAGTDALVIFFRSTGHTLLQSVFYQGLSSDPVDKTISYLLVFFLVRNLPARLLNRFKGAANIITTPS